MDNMKNIANIAPSFRRDPRNPNNVRFGSNIADLAPSHRNAADSPYAQPVGVPRLARSLNYLYMPAPKLHPQEPSQVTSTPNDSLMSNLGHVRPDFSNLPHGSSIDSSSTDAPLPPFPHRPTPMPARQIQPQQSQTNHLPLFNHQNKQHQNIAQVWPNSYYMSNMQFSKMNVLPAHSPVPSQGFTYRDIETRPPHQASPQRPPNAIYVNLLPPSDTAEFMTANARNNEKPEKPPRSTFHHPSKNRPASVRFNLEPVVHEISITSDSQSKLVPSNSERPSSPRPALPASPSGLFSSDSNNNQFTRNKYSSLDRFSDDTYEAIKQLNSTEPTAKTTFASSFKTSFQRNLKTIGIALGLLMMILAIVLIVLVFALGIHDVSPDDLFNTFKSIFTHQH